MTLLTSIQQAWNELGVGTNAPTTIFGNTDPQVMQFLALATREGFEFSSIGGQWNGWPELRKEYTFSLVPATGGNAGVYVGNTTINSNVLTGFTSTTGVLVGYGVSGGSILTGAIVTGVSPGPNGTISLNTPANATSTGQNFSFGQITYALPSDIQMFITATQWDRNFRWQMLGPISAQEWQTIVSGICPVGPRIRFRIMDNEMWIQPPPGVAQTDVIAYEYISTNWCESSTGTGQANWQADTDTWLWPETCLQLGLKWRWLRSKGLDYTEERAMYDYAVQRQTSRSGTTRNLPMNAHSNGLRLLNQSNIPDTGFGT